jgi:ATP-dependent RNA helicase DDX20
MFKKTQKSIKVHTKDVEIDDKTLSFNEMCLSACLLDGLKQAGFYKPSPIQLKAIPLGKLGLGKLCYKIKNKRN